MGFREIIKYLADYNYMTIIIRLSTAVLLGGIIGSERGRHGRAAGLRTHILICVGACITSLTSMFLSKELGYNGDVARLSAQVISGIGFLGAGTILVRNSSIVTGLTTAAGMWATASIGIAIGYGFYFGALFATFICIVSVTLLGKIERKRRIIIPVYIEFDNILYINQAISIVQDDAALISYDIVAPKSGINNNVGIILSIQDKIGFENIKSKIVKLGPVIVACDINS